MERFYVYIYLDQTRPGKWTYKNLTFEYEPFYVGKGTGRRETVHLTPHMLKQKTMKSSRIKHIMRISNETPIHTRLYIDLTEERAVEVEKDMIRHFGRKDLKTGILTNMTDGGDGANGFAPQTRARLRWKNIDGYYQYTLDGTYLRRWSDWDEICAEFRTPSNICSAIKREGTFCGYQWFYTYQGERVPSKTRFQMPVIHKNLKQVDLTTGKVVATYKSAREAEETLKLRPGAQSRILECANGRGPNKSAFGFYWTTDEVPKLPKRRYNGVYQFDMKGKPLNCFTGLKQAAAQTRLCKNHIMRCCRKELDSWGGFRWSYSHVL